MSERPFGNYCHKHSKGMYSRCQDCIDELTALGIQSDKDKIANLDAEVRRLREENERLLKDAERLDWISEEYAHLQPFGIPTGEGDYDTGWRVLQEHCCHPEPQIVTEIYFDSVRTAIDAARGEA